MYDGQSLHRSLLSVVLLYHEQLFRQESYQSRDPTLVLQTRRLREAASSSPVSFAVSFAKLDFVQFESGKGQLFSDNAHLILCW